MTCEKSRGLELRYKASLTQKIGLNAAPTKEKRRWMLISIYQKSSFHEPNNKRYSLYQ